MTRFRTYTFGVLAATAVLGACSDAPTAVAPSAAVVEATGAANGQTAQIGAKVAVAPAVVVKDGRGKPLSGQLVVFTATRGGGSVASTNARTDATGTASAGSWQLGPEPGVNEVTATVGKLAPVRFTAVSLAAGTAGDPGAAVGEFDITIRYLGTPTQRQREAVSRAVLRWRSVITGDLPSIPVTAAAAACFEAQPALNETVDDILIFVDFKEIDGAGKILGEAGPCLVRNDSKLPVVGHLRLDAADLAQMERAGTLDDVVLHEIGHVLGIGTLWSYKGLIEGAGGADPVFTGSGALGAYLGMGVASAAGVPVENTGGAGTREGHWRESVFGNELMTGFIGGTPNPLSALTVASLKDLGYGTSSSGAATFTLGGAPLSSMLAEPMDLRHREKVKGPKFEVDRSGRQKRLDMSHRH